MPPVTRIGVSAIASSPSSTLSRAISKMLPVVAKFGATSEKTAISIASAAATAHSPFARTLPRHRSGAIQARPVASAVWLAGRAPQRVRRDRGEDDGALDRPLPIGAHAQKCQRGPNHAEQDDAKQCAHHASSPAGDRGAADDDGRDHLHLESETGVARDLIEADGVQQRGEPRSARRRRRTPRMSREACGSRRGAPRPDWIPSRRPPVRQEGSAVPTRARRTAQAR